MTSLPDLAAARALWARAHSVTRCVRWCGVRCRGLVSCGWSRKRLPAERLSGGGAAGRSSEVDVEGARCWVQRWCAREVGVSVAVLSAVGAAFLPRVAPAASVVERRPEYRWPVRGFRVCAVFQPLALSRCLFSCSVERRPVFALISRRSRAARRRRVCGLCGRLAVALRPVRRSLSLSRWPRVVVRPVLQFVACCLSFVFAGRARAFRLVLAVVSQRGVLVVLFFLCLFAVFFSLLRSLGLRRAVPFSVLRAARRSLGRRPFSPSGVVCCRLSLGRWRRFRLWFRSFPLLPCFSRSFARRPGFRGAGSRFFPFPVGGGSVVVVCLVAGAAVVGVGLLF